MEVDVLIRRFEAWPETSTPPFAHIATLGCCEEHEGGFLYYRKTSWKEFRDLLLSSQNLLQAIDSFEFCTLAPEAWRYFMKGALSALTRYVSRAKSWDHSEIPFEVWQWISHDEKDIATLVEWERQHPGEKFSGNLSKSEIGDILDLLELFSKLKIKDQKDQKDLRSTTDYWKRLHSHFF